MNHIIHLLQTAPRDASRWRSKELRYATIQYNTITLLRRQVG